jgi:hypothetical protein
MAGGIHGSIGPLKAEDAGMRRNNGWTVNG